MLRRHRSPGQTFTTSEKTKKQLEAWSDVGFPCRIIRKESHVTSSFCKSLEALWSTEWGERKKKPSLIGLFFSLTFLLLANGTVLKLFERISDEN